MKHEPMNTQDDRLKLANWIVDGARMITDLKTTRDFNPEMAFAMIDAAAKVVSEINDRA